MKSKFSSMWRVTIALVMVLSFGLMAAPVAATVDTVEVTLDDATPGASAEYTIEFTTTEDLETGDGIVIEFPETGGTDIAAIVDAADVEVTPGSFTEVVDIVGQRLSITLNAALAAGNITVLVGTSNKVTNPADGDYTLDVYTSQEPTRVTSAEYMISGEASIANVTPTSTTVDTLAGYGFDLTTITALAVGDDIFIEFPVDTDISALVKADIIFNPTETVDHIHIDGQVLTINLGTELAVSAPVAVAIAAYITNPTTVLNPDPYEDVDGNVDDPTEWRLTVYTTKDRVLCVSTVYLLSEGLPVSQVAWLTVDEYVPNDAPSTAFVIQTQDQYGNSADVVAGPLTFDLTASSGDFYSNVACERTQEITTIVISASDSAEFFYKGATAGTVTITADEEVDEGWTAAEDTILVNPVLELWGGGAWIADYGTFALAIDAALPFDTIKVAPSTYDGFSVSKPGITIESTDGAATTIIEGNIKLTAGADSLVLGGSADHGFTLKKGIESLIAVEGPTDVEISYNMFDTTRIPGETQVDAIRIWQQASSGLTVTENTFSLDSLFDMGVRGHASASVSGLTVADNIFTGVGSTLDHNAIEINTLDITSTNSTISGNGITGVMNGVLIGDGGGQGLVGGDTNTGTLEISGNTFDGLKYGIYLLEVPGGNNDQNVVITENTFTNNTKGLAISDDADWEPVDFTVMYNDFVGNTHAVFNNHTVAVVAQYNWWGDITGPSADPDADPDALPTAYGEGDAISALVTPYDPWLAVSQSVCVPATSSRYAIEIRLTHVASYSAGTWSGGWNTFSTPISLHGDGDTWGELIALVDLQAAMVYGWDGTTWIAPFPSTTVITPLDAIFVQMKEEARLPILFSTQLSPAATKDLSAGWNLIGSASLSEMTRDDALASLGTVNGGDLKYSQVIDPISGVVLGETSNMLPGQGFWVFMTADATLAGFECTPQPWVLPVLPE